MAKINVSSQFIEALRGELKLVDGQPLNQLIASYAGVSFAPNRSGVLETKARIGGGPQKNKLIDKVGYKMPFIQWRALAEFVVEFAPTRDSAKGLISTLPFNDIIEEGLKYSDTGIKTFVEYQNGYEFGVNINSIFVEGLHNHEVDGESVNAFDLDAGISMSGTTGMTVTIVDTDFVVQGSDTVTLDSLGRATASISLSSFVEGYVYISACPLFYKADYVGTLKSNLNIAQLIDFSSYNYVAIPATIAANEASVVSAKNGVVEIYNQIKDAG